MVVVPRGKGIEKEGATSRPPPFRYGRLKTCAAVNKNEETLWNGLLLSTFIYYSHVRLIVHPSAKCQLVARTTHHAHAPS